jgi:hypothetical protein
MHIGAQSFSVAAITGKVADIKSLPWPTIASSRGANISFARQSYLCASAYICGQKHLQCCGRLWPHQPGFELLER